MIFVIFTLLFVSSHAFLFGEKGMCHTFGVRILSMVKTLVE